jgi:hypothetical protein
MDDYRDTLKIPEGHVGDMQIRHIVHPADHCLPLSIPRTTLMGGQEPGNVRYAEPTLWHQLISDEDGLWMSDLPIEQIQHRNSLEPVARGDKVLIALIHHGAFKGIGIMDPGFTGTQTGVTSAQLDSLAVQLRVLNALETINQFHHGDCVGADETAHHLAQSLSWDIVIHPPLNASKRAFCKGAVATWQRKPYLDRNHDIVDCCDILIACPSGTEHRRSGTWSTVRYARKERKPIVIVWPNGKVTYE